MPRSGNPPAVRDIKAVNGVLGCAALDRAALSSSGATALEQLWRPALQANRSGRLLRRQGAQVGDQRAHVLGRILRVVARRPSAASAGGRPCDTRCGWRCSISASLHCRARLGIGGDVARNADAPRPVELAGRRRRACVSNWKRPCRAHRRVALDAMAERAGEIGAVGDLVGPGRRGDRLRHRRAVGRRQRHVVGRLRAPCC